MTGLGIGEPFVSIFKPLIGEPDFNDLISVFARAITAAVEADIAKQEAKLAEQASVSVAPSRVPPPRERDDLEALGNELAEFLGFATPQALSFDNLLDTMAQLLLNPTRTPGEPCLAPAPLLRDLLDLALGRLTGVIGSLIGTVGGTIDELLLPGFAAEGELTQFIQSILDDPITAALNLVLGQRDKIDCVVEGGLSVGESVFEAGVRSLKEAVAEGLG